MVMDLIEILHTALNRIHEARLFATERGYQGQLRGEIDNLIGERNALLRPLVEEEHQKRLGDHGTRLRPDIIVHVPYERGVSPTRRHDNYLVILLKLSAGRSKAHEDFDRLARMCSALDYPLAAFVNVSSTHLWLPAYERPQGPFTLFEFAVTLVDGKPHIVSSNA